MARVLVAGEPFDETVSFFQDQLGFRLELITPADDPALAVLQGPGLTVQVDRNRTAPPVTLLVEGDGPPVQAPNGTTIEFIPPRELEVPVLVPELIVEHEAAENAWVPGRAGMRYRDLLPSRLGGRFIASDIEVCDGGPVNDFVHHHDIRFQMIFCHQGWVDVVYQDQGPPFRLEAGDAVLQPPGIRHQVLASSAGARVVEIGCPATHDTMVDHDLVLPNDEFNPMRQFGGQLFARHVAADAPWQPSTVLAGFEAQDTGIAAATNGIAGVRILRAAPTAEGAMPELEPTRAMSELHFFHVLKGSAELHADEVHQLVPGTAVALPPGQSFTLRATDADFEVLEVTMPVSPAEPSQLVN